MYIDEEKIRKAVSYLLFNGENKMAVFPYGFYGKMVYKYLQKHEIEAEIIDNFCGEYKSFPEFVKENKDYVILFSAMTDNTRKECIQQIKESGVKYVDLAAFPTRSYFPWNSRKLTIDECTEKERNSIFEQTKKAWEKLGNENPYWSVITQDKFKEQNMTDDVKTEFYESGLEYRIAIENTLLRNGIIDETKDTKMLEIIEIGCGTGRITTHLADAFAKVWAYDISSGNLSIAKQQANKNNIEYTLITNVEAYAEMPKVDAVYSVLVLQHNCPPVIEYMLETMFSALKKGGICMFQVPTYEKGYLFVYSEYIEDSGKQMEMHLLPQKRIFEIAYKCGCIPLEVYEYDVTGKHDYSTMFVFKKLEEKR